MGYYTRFTGEIEISPPVLVEDIKDGPWYDPNREFLTGREFRIDSDEEDYSAIVPVSDDSYKGYHALATLQEIADQFSDRTFRGEIRAEGEAVGDIRRYLIKDGKAVEERAAIIWPDGTTEKPR